MTDQQDVTLARLEERGKSRDARIKKLEDNQRWFLITIFGLLAKVVVDLAAAGGLT